MSYVVITNCSNRKRHPPRSNLQARNLVQGPLQDLATEWTGRVSDAPSEASAIDMYCGRAFSEVSHAASELNADLLIVSAGLGLIRGTTHVPSYSLTSAPGSEDSIAAKVACSQWSPKAWWSAISSLSAISNSLHQVFDEREGSSVLAVLPENYALLLSEELEGLSDQYLDRLRLFGLRLTNVLNPRLHKCVLPYDRRLDGPSSPIRGTLFDFGSRALRHFTSLIKNNKAGKADIAADRRAVTAVLKSWADPPEILTRTPKSDDEIQALIQNHWHEVQGRSGKMLRFLRDRLLVACEQGRFRRLFNEVAKERLLLTGDSA